MENSASISTIHIRSITDKSHSSNSNHKSPTIHEHEKTVETDDEQIAKVGTGLEEMKSSAYENGDQLITISLSDISISKAPSWCYIDKKELNCALLSHHEFKCNTEFTNIFLLVSLIFGATATLVSAILLSQLLTKESGMQSGDLKGKMTIELITGLTQLLFSLYAVFRQSPLVSIVIAHMFLGCMNLIITGSTLAHNFGSYPSASFGTVGFSILEMPSYVYIFVFGVNGTFCTMGTVYFFLQIFVRDCGHKRIL